MKNILQLQKRPLPLNWSKGKSISVCLYTSSPTTKEGNINPQEGMQLLWLKILRKDLRQEVSLAISCEEEIFMNKLCKVNPWT